MNQMFFNDLNNAKQIMPEEWKHRGVAERLRAAVERDPFTIRSNGRKLPVTISIGVAAAAGDGDRELLLKHADDALYSAKTRGRNCVMVREPDSAAAAMAAPPAGDAATLRS